MSRRQREVYELKRSGLSNRAVAFALGVAVGTVARHAHRAYRKIGVDETARRDAQQSGHTNALGRRTWPPPIPSPNPALVHTIDNVW